MKAFVRALDTNGTAFQYLKEKFGVHKSDAKLKAGVFIGPEIRNLLHDAVFKLNLNPKELAAWEAFTDVAQHFLGNHRAENYAQLISTMVESYHRLGARMSIKLHFLDSHLDFFPQNLGDVSDEHGERFHQEIKVIESRYQGQVGPNMMGDYCWFLYRETSSSHGRKSKRGKYF